MPVIVQLWIENLKEDFPDLPKKVLATELKEVLQTIQNERLWALGSKNQLETNIHYQNVTNNTIYSEWLISQIERKEA